MDERDRRGERGASLRAVDGMVRGYVPGVYDMFHVGHLNILKQARERCDWLIAGVVSDEKAARVKGKHPVVPLLERVAILEHIDLVDEVVIETQPTKVDLWQRPPVRGDLQGRRLAGHPRGLKLESDMASVGVAVAYFPYTVHTSSTLLRAVLEDAAS